VIEMGQTAQVQRDRLNRGSLNKLVLAYTYASSTSRSRTETR